LIERRQANRGAFAVLLAGGWGFGPGWRDGRARRLWPDRAPGVGQMSVGLRVGASRGDAIGALTRREEEHILAGDDVLREREVAFLTSEGPGAGGEAREGDLGLLPRFKVESQGLVHEGR